MVHAVVLKMVKNVAKVIEEVAKVLVDVFMVKNDVQVSVEVVPVEDTKTGSLFVLFFAYLSDK